MCCIAEHCLFLQAYSVPHQVYTFSLIRMCHLLSKNIFGSLNCLVANYFDPVLKVMANAFSIHMDPKYWNDPENFIPERFLDEKRMITGSEHVLAFGLGMI